MSDTQSQAEPTARVVAFVDEGDAATERIVADLIKSHGWARRRTAAVDYEVIQLDRPIGTSDEVSKKAGEVHEELSGAGIEPAAVAAYLIAPTGKFDPSGGLHIQNLAGTLDGNEFSKLIEVLVPRDGATSNDGGTPPDNGTPPNPPGGGATTDQGIAQSGAGEGEAKTAAAPAPADPAATIAAAIPAFPDPAPLWRYVDKAERSDLARGMISGLHANRTDFARRSEWIVAPEMVLLDACPSAQREDLAMKMLKVRAALTSADEDTRRAAADLATKNVELAGKRVELADQGVRLAGEMLKHMKKWRSIANWGLFVLCVTTLFSMVAVAYLLLHLIPAGKIGEVAAPILVFVLALFAISPAVLLLRERPLEGLDKWSPGGGAGDGKEAGSGADGSAGSSSGDSAAKQPAADASKPA